MFELTEITFPSADRDRLIFAPSFNLSPVAPVESALSDPRGKWKVMLSYKIMQLANVFA